MDICFYGGVIKYMKQELIDRIKNMEQLAKSSGLDFYSTVFEVVNRDIMLEACSYGLPVRARHWSYGRTYEHQKVYGEMGYSKVYEIVFNNDPSYAFLLDTNPDIINIMVAAHVYGHCIKYDQLVDTIDGPKQISNINVGDLVLTHSGTYKRVLKAQETAKVNEIYSIKTYGYSPTECTSDHKFYVKRDKKNIWVAAKDLLNSDMIAIPRTKINNKINNINIPILVSRTTPLRKKTIAKNGYEFKLDYDFGRIVGLYLAEGSVSINRFSFTFGGKEQDFADFVKSYFDKYNITVKIKSRNPKQNCIDVQCFDKSIAQWFDDNFGHGCANKHIPGFLINNANKEFYEGLLRGYFDGDGWVEDEQTHASASTISMKLAYQIKNLCAVFGIKAGINVQNRNNRRRSYNIIVSGKNYDYMMDICKVHRTNIPKRRWLFNEVDENYIYNRIKEISIIKTNPTSVWDLEVEEDHSFVLSNGMTAHNCHFFKHNVMFQKSDRNMVHRAAERATRIDQYIEQYGLDKVENLMDMAFAVDNHIDWQKGVFRKKYGSKKIIEEKISFGEFEDLLNPGANNRSIRKRVEGSRFPPNPERDILWFLINYAPLEEWERDVLSIIREESYYFYPIVMTKIMNEGFASFWHAELMYKCDEIKEQDHIEFCKCHSSVVSPGSSFQMNPYYLGFKIFTNIREKWDKLHAAGESEITGIQKIIQVAEEEDDASFLRNYLTLELAEELGLFNYGYRNTKNLRENEKADEEYGIIELKDRELSKIVENIIKPTLNYGAPLITISEVDGDTLVLEHKDTLGTLDAKYAEKVIEYLFKLWGGPVELKTYNKDKEKFSYYYDESGWDIL